jgi:hypothetical protein
MISYKRHCTSPPSTPTLPLSPFYLYVNILLGVNQKTCAAIPGVALPVTDTANPYRMAAIQGRVVEVPPDEDCRYMDAISFKYTNAPFPCRGPDHVCFVIAVDKAAQQILFTHNPG